MNDLLVTCQSVDLQNQTPLEHLIIDGSTKSEIKNYFEQKTQPMYRRWLCEPDRGISDAFNKGITNSNGDIVVMLNSGDTFADENILEIVGKKFKEDSNLKWLHGKYKSLRGNEWVVLGKPFEKKKLYRGMRSICHQTMFVKKDLHTKYGQYNIEERIAMDYDFLCRIANERFLFLPITMVNYAPAGESSKNYLPSLKEAKNVYERYFGRSVKLKLWQLRLKLLYYLLRSPIGNILYKIKTRLNLENM